ncbi:MAG: hypothetical protein WAW06_02005, partial [bacterium]
TLDQIQKSRRDCVKFFRQWQKAVGVHGRDAQWYDLGSIRGMYYSLLLGVALIPVTVLLGFLFRFWAVPLGAAAMAILVLSFLIPHRTAQGEVKARQWKAVGKYLSTEQYRSLQSHDLLGRISRYMVYGGVLGLSSKAYGELAAMVPEGQRGTYISWYAHSAGGGSAADFGSAFSAMVATTSSSMSSASGSGGGASGGGGGGAGGGGGGAG